MGNWLSVFSLNCFNNKKQTNQKKENECVICAKQIFENTYIKCVLCNMTMHHECDETHKSTNICPQCSRCGTLCNYTGADGWTTRIPLSVNKTIDI